MSFAHIAPSGVLIAELEPSVGTGSPAWATHHPLRLLQIPALGTGVELTVRVSKVLGAIGPFAERPASRPILARSVGAGRGRTHGEEAGGGHIAAAIVWVSVFFIVVASVRQGVLSATLTTSPKDGKPNGRTLPTP